MITINAVNFVDGLDGLAAGMVGDRRRRPSSCTRTYLVRDGYGDVASAPPLLTAVLAGMCLGFLPHNFNPARIFMGDSGSMLIGLLLAASAITADRARSTRRRSRLGRPTRCRRTCRSCCRWRCSPSRSSTWCWPWSGGSGPGRSPFAPDKLHLHHRLLEIGHSQRRAC